MSNIADNRKLEIIKNKLVFDKNYTIKEIELISMTISECEISDYWDDEYYNFWEFYKSYGVYFAKRFTWRGSSIGGQKYLLLFVDDIKNYYDGIKEEIINEF